MKREVLRQSGANQRILLLPVKTFLEITEIPESQRQVGGGTRARSGAAAKSNVKAPPAEAHNPR